MGTPHFPLPLSVWVSAHNQGPLAVAFLGPPGTVFAEHTCLDADFFLSETIFLFKENVMNKHVNHGSGLCFVFCKKTFFLKRFLLLSLGGVWGAQLVLQRLLLQDAAPFLGSLSHLLNACQKHGRNGPASKWLWKLGMMAERSPLAAVRTASGCDLGQISSPCLCVLVCKVGE